MSISQRGGNCKGLVIAGDYRQAVNELFVLELFYLLFENKDSFSHDFHGFVGGLNGESKLANEFGHSFLLLCRFVNQCCHDQVGICDFFFTHLTLHELTDEPDIIVPEVRGMVCGEVIGFMSRRYESPATSSKHFE